MRGLSLFKSLFVLLGVLWLGAILVAGFLRPQMGTNSEPQIGPLLTQIQNLGQLHTVRYNMQDVVEHERSLAPDGWIGKVPGVEGLCRAATRNQVLVVAHGGVEAGVDLSRVAPQDVTRVQTPQGTRLRVHLPHARLYTPDVKVKVEQVSPGLFWTDDNIVPAATEEAQRRMTESAIRSHILAEAEANAVRTLDGMQQAMGNRSVEFYF